ncbi:ribosome biogenesis protein Sqt1 [Cristinia sonorae]|uniref:Ribosome biogenesis protein Sqt1 n=1 Tax=Cristinia sonorae TaxID=1940300 RepID=A0A8K0XPB7_9AGAR|nr:ribosome biogenesis protein Sqt1 [Cristinia sonorae]
MAAEREHDDHIHGEDDDFIDPNDVVDVIELGDDGDAPMDEDDDRPDFPVGGSFHIDEDGNLQPDEPEDEDEDPNYTDASIRHFPSHKGSVFVVSTHPTAPIAASGGEDDLGYIWDYSTGEELVRLTGHTDSVTSTAFSNDGELISTGGMDGKVRVWRRVGKDNWKRWEFLTELQGPDEVMWLRWHPKGNVLLAGSNDTTVWLWQLPSGNTMQVFAGHTGPVQCGEFTPDGKRIITADAEGNLIFWDPRSPTPVFKLGAHDARFSVDSITSLAVNPASTLAVVGGSSGGVRVVSLSKGEVVGALGGHKEDDSVESVVFVDLAGAGQVGTGGVVVTGATDGKACIWDLSTMRLRATLEHEDAITSLLALKPPKSYVLVSASADRTLKTWDARTGTLLKEHKGHRGPVLSAALGHNGDNIITAGDDGVCLVFDTQ